MLVRGLYGFHSPLDTHNATDRVREMHIHTRIIVKYTAAFNIIQHYVTQCMCICTSDITQPSPPLAYVPRLLPHQSVHLELVVPTATEEPVNRREVVVRHTPSCKGTGEGGTARRVTFSISTVLLSKRSRHAPSLKVSV